jgi:hypothetical protein
MENKQFNTIPPPVPLQASSSSYRTKVSDLLASGPRTGRSQLAADFKPSDFSVICGRGKESYDHVGNHHFRELASMFVARYSRANSKADKSEIVSEMVGMIHQAEGTFCKLEKGIWFKVGDHYAREKAGALLRDMMLAQQRPPVKAKMAKKLKKTKAKPARPRLQKQSKTQKHQQNGQKRIVGTAGHLDNSTLTQAQHIHQLVDGTTCHSNYCAPTQPCGVQLVEDSTAAEGDSDDSSMSTWSSCWGQELLGFDKDDFVNTSFRMDSLEDEDDYCDVFGMDSLLHASSLMPVTSGAAAKCCNVGVPSLLIIPAAY